MNSKSGDLKNLKNDSVKIYRDAKVIKSKLDDFSSVGDFSKVINSQLLTCVRIDRNNHIESSNIGSYTYTGRNTIVIHSHIGAFTSISWNVSIGGANHDYNRMTQHSFLYNSIDNIRPDFEAEYDRFKDPVLIGNDVWIAAGAIVTRGVTIGDGAVIGANSVVTKDVPPYAIVAGVPAKVIKYRFTPDVIELLLKIKWWDWPIEKIKSNYTILSQQPCAETLKVLLR